MEIRICKNEDKLFTAIPSDVILFSDIVLDLLGHYFQHHITCKVTMCVIDLLEVVEVEDAQRKGTSPTVGKPFFPQEDMEQVAPVEHPGEVIVDRLQLDQLKSIVEFSVGLAQFFSQHIDVASYGGEPYEHGKENRKIEQLYSEVDVFRAIGEQEQDHKAISHESDYGEQEKLSKIQSEHSEYEDHHVE